MASELIAEAITDYFGERCLDYAEGCPTCEAWAEYDRWNTRPAPADGLERYRPEPMSLGGMVRDPDGGYVTRSQAEELLAAQRAETERLADDYQAIREQLHRGWQECCALKADNAEKDARVKELEEDVEWAQNAVLARQRHAEARCEALEAKLAAAEKINDAMRKAAVDYCWQRYKGRDPLNLKNPAVFTSHEWEKIGETMDAAARAVLGGKPSC